MRRNVRLLTLAAALCLAQPAPAQTPNEPMKILVHRMFVY